MIKIEGTVTPSPEQWHITIMGARNAMNSWDKRDSEIKYENVRDSTGKLVIGPADMKLLMNLRNAGTDERKYMRMLTVHVHITAPLYWLKEFDTYKVGTVANSCSTMHKIHEKEFTLDDFSHEHLLGPYDEDGNEVDTIIDVSSTRDGSEYYSPRGVLGITIKMLNKCRNKYFETKNKAMKNEAARKPLMKKYWWQMIQLLPSSYNQRRTVMLNYEVLANMYRARKNHKLDEWREFCKWIEGLPYSELITGKEAENDA